MQTTFALAAAFVGVALAASPTGSAPAGFVTTYPGSFQITPVNTTVLAAKRDIAKRAACPTSDGSLVITLKDGVLTDQAGRIADIVANHQFQFDPAPGQAGAIYTSGFSVGTNNSLALGSSAIFYRCLSGTFYNLYSQPSGALCEQILIDILPCGASSSATVTQASDGQPAASTIATAVSQKTDGQPQAPTAISQISDGQPQLPTAVISQISDGQVQAPTSTAVAVSQISDGQVQAPTSTAAPVSQISDGQVQAPTSTAAPISQISDGQVQAPTSTATPITQISDGQPQAGTTLKSVASASGTITAASNGTAVTTPTSPPIVTSSGNTIVIGSSFAAIIACLFAVLL